MNRLLQISASSLHGLALANEKVGEKFEKYFVSSNCVK
jgi:hypothetical protein